MKQQNNKTNKQGNKQFQAGRPVGSIPNSVKLPAPRNGIIEKLISKMQIKWETDDKFRLPDVVYESFNQGSLSKVLSKEKDILKILDEIFEKKKLSLKELGLPLEDWWGESEVFSVNELEELKNRIKSK